MPSFRDQRSGEADLTALLNSATIGFSIAGGLRQLRRRKKRAASAVRPPLLSSACDLPRNSRQAGHASARFSACPINSSAARGGALRDWQGSRYRVRAHGGELAIGRRPRHDLSKWPEPFSIRSPGVLEDPRQGTVEHAASPWPSRSWSKLANWVARGLGSASCAGPIRRAGSPGTEGAFRFLTIRCTGVVLEPPEPPAIFCTAWDTRCGPSTPKPPPLVQHVGSMDHSVMVILLAAEVRCSASSTGRARMMV